MPNRNITKKPPSRAMETADNNGKTSMKILN